ncbi:hypothetical protein B0T12DRAFT_2634 [Alternaria alternata]|nr:hypothetical protein B0T12DRAFT_2634 [Alternaria alternata]
MAPLHNGLAMICFPLPLTTHFCTYRFHSKSCHWHTCASFTQCLKPSCCVSTCPFRGCDSCSGGRPKRSACFTCERRPGGLDSPLMTQHRTNVTVSLTKSHGTHAQTYTY